MTESTFSPTDAAAEVDRLRVSLQIAGDPRRAVSEAAYLKSELQHFGTAVPQVRRVAKIWLRAHPQLHHDQLVAVVDALWLEPIHELRLCAVELLLASPKLLGVADLPWLESLLRRCGTWALLDALASDGVGRIVRADTAALAVLDRWVGDPDFWIRRSAVLALRPSLRDGHQLERFLTYADLLLPEREFFIRKAIGWVAREVGRRQPEVISSWLRRNMAGMNMVTLREAAKHIPDGDELLTAYRQRTRR
jgi:3-methyladenine DNA glycosylase AlkD